jgi:hypothetical protein
LGTNSNTREETHTTSAFCGELLPSCFRDVLNGLSGFDFLNNNTTVNIP